MTHLLGLSLVLVYLTKCAPMEQDENFAMNFLTKYKYLPHYQYDGASDISEGIKRFQQFFNLPITGVLDQTTKRLMKKPRCGNADLRTGKRFLVAAPWRKTHLTYNFINYCQDLPLRKVKKIFAKAFAFWSQVSGLTFSKSKSTSKKADINILFGTYNHGDKYPFDGPGGTLAHAFFPSDGRIHFDEDELYTHGTPAGTNLLWVAVHELGHALGLYHTNIFGAIMYPYYQGYKPNMKLHKDDIQGIQSLYPPKGPVTNPPVQSTTPDSQNRLKDCKDKISNCADLDKADYCQLHSDQMAIYCRKTCKLCGRNR